METRISSANKEVIIGDQYPTVLIGERISPSGGKSLSEALKLGNTETVQKEALAQVQAGADIINVNTGIFGIDEVILLPKIIQEIEAVIDVPLCIDSSHPAAIEAALKAYHGKALINSITGGERSLAEILPLVKEYGAAVIGLTQDDKGIPSEPERRLAIAYRIVEASEAAGIPRNNIIIDCLTLSIGAEPRSALVALEAIRQVKEELGVNQVLGISNVSFGLPERSFLNGAYLAMAIAAGVTCLILNVAKMRPMVLAADLVLGHDKRARRYIQAYRQQYKRRQ